MRHCFERADKGLRFSSPRGGGIVGWDFAPEMAVLKFILNFERIRAKFQSIYNTDDMGDLLEHSYNRRKRGHDYYGPFVYHVILKKLPTAPVFGKIIGNPAIPPKQPGSARTDYSKMGYAIYNALRDFENRYPEFKKWQYSIMPDHLHIILQKKCRTDIHLEEYMKILKKMVADFYHAEGNPYIAPDDIFTERFTDKLLYRRIKLRDWIEYVEQNPHRRAMILQRPDFFKRVSKLEINGKFYNAYGNLFLFRNPDKFGVRVRRRFTPQKVEEHKNLALSHASEGTVLVSPFISDPEKDIREKAETMGAKLILIQHEELGEGFKPAKHNFQLCSKGQLLIISLGMPKGTALTYQIATTMNELAASICAHSIHPFRDENRSGEGENRG